MYNLKIFSLCICVVVFGWSLALPQGPPPSLSGSNGPQTKSSTFLSLDGGFSIDLPSYPSSYEGVKSIPNVSNGGSKYTWKSPVGYFMIEYVSPLNTPENLKGHLKEADERSMAKLSALGVKIISRVEINVDGYPASDIKFSRDGNIYLSRSINAPGKYYVLTTYWKENEDSAAPLKILDSFKLIDVKSILAQKLADATPESLPQSPVVRKAKSDAEDAFLRGRVKSVVETKEYLDATGSVSGIIHTREWYFDENGNLVKQILYDYRGNPFYVTAYGFTDGKRVSKRGGFINYSYNPPPMAIPPGGVPKQKVRKQEDDRYSQSFEYKYDNNGRLIEKLSFNNRSELDSKDVFTHDGNKVTEVVTDKDGKITSKMLHVYDDKFNPIEQIYYSTSTSYPDDSKYGYTYLAFDSNGNWTKREEKGKTSKYGGGTNDLHSYEYRVISYY